MLGVVFLVFMIFNNFMIFVGEKKCKFIMFLGCEVVVVILLILSVEVFEVRMVFGLYILLRVENMVFFIFIFLNMVFIIRLIFVKFL